MYRDRAWRRRDRTGAPDVGHPWRKVRSAEAAELAGEDAEIGRTFQRMSEEGERDSSRPSIEFYRSEKALVLFLPMK